MHYNVIFQQCLVRGWLRDVDVVWLDEKRIKPGVTWCDKVPSVLTEVAIGKMMPPRFQALIQILQ